MESIIRRMSSISMLLMLMLIMLPSTQASITREIPPRETAPTSVFYDAFSTRIFDPQGRVLQLEYALQATKKGGAAVGAISRNLAVLANWNPRQSIRQAPASQQAAIGIWKGDEHVALAASGMSTDAMMLAEIARRECLSHKYIYDSPMGISRLVLQLAQEVYETERHRVVPYAIDLLVCGCDLSTGPSLYNIGPAGIYQSYRAVAVGSRANQANAYLQGKLDGGVSSVGMKGLIEIAMRALMTTVPRHDDEVEGEEKDGEGRKRSQSFTEDISVVVVGRGVPVTFLTASWDTRTRKVEIIIPKDLAPLLVDDEKEEAEKSSSSSSRKG